MHVFCICTCSAQLRVFHMERRSRNTLIIIIIIKRCARGVNITSMCTGNVTVTGVLEV